MLPLLESDLYPTLLACSQLPSGGQPARPTLAQVRPRFCRSRVCLAVTLASAGYPGDRHYQHVPIILATPDPDAGPTGSGAGTGGGLVVFHAGTRLATRPAAHSEAAASTRTRGTSGGAEAEAGVALLETNGGRVFTAIALADIEQHEHVAVGSQVLAGRPPHLVDATAAALYRAWRRAMQLVEHVSFEGKQFRSDIGLRAIMRGFAVLLLYCTVLYLVYLMLIRSSQYFVYLKLSQLRLNFVRERHMYSYNVHVHYLRVLY